MYYSTQYASVLGLLTLAGDGDNLNGLWLEGQKYFGGKYFRDSGKNEVIPKDDLPVFAAAKHWLDRYFAGESRCVRSFLCYLPERNFRKRSGSFSVKFRTAR